MAKKEASLTSFAGRLLTENELAVFMELMQYTKPVLFIDIYDGLLKKIHDNQIVLILDTLTRGPEPLVKRVVKRRFYMKQEILVEYWELSTYAKKFVDVNNQSVSTSQLGDTTCHLVHGLKPSCGSVRQTARNSSD